MTEIERVRAAGLKLCQAVAEMAKWHMLGIATYVNDPPSDKDELGCSKEYQEGHLDAMKTFAVEHLEPLVKVHNEVLAELQVNDQSCQSK